MAKPSDHTYEDICTFCCEVSGDSESNLFYDLALASTRGDYILYETDNFVVMPCIGALTDWYVLLVSKRHVLSVGWLSAEEHDDLRRVLSYVRRKLGELAGSETMVFEHGSYDFRDKGGACYDHAHIHVVAADHSADEFVQHIPASVVMHECDDWISESSLLVQQQRLSYLALEPSDGQMVGVATGAPSQFFRRCLARWLGADDGEWDWLIYPQIDRVRNMAKARWPWQMM